MKLIELTKGFFTKVDDADYDLLSQFEWCAKQKGKKFFLQATGTEFTTTQFFHCFGKYRDQCAKFFDAHAQFMLNGEQCWVRPY